MMATMTDVMKTRSVYELAAIRPMFEPRELPLRLKKGLLVFAHPINMCLTIPEDALITLRGRDLVLCTGGSETVIVSLDALGPQESPKDVILVWEEAPDERD